MKSFCSSFGSKLLAATICCGIAIIISGEIYYDSLPHFRGLPHVGIGSQDVYRVKPYIAAAIELQKMGQVKAEQHMMKYAKKYHLDSDQVYIFCRMLYTKREINWFTQPPLGRPSCIGGTSYLDWKLCPIEMVDGIPFLIATDYSTYSAPGIPSEYLNFCMTNCEWNQFSYQEKSDQELNTALNKLLSSPNWKRPLTPEEKEWLTVQIY